MVTKILLVSLLFICSTLAVPIVNQPAGSISEFKLIWTVELVREQLNIEKLAAEYNRNKDWAALRKGLEAVLSEDSAAYHQLRAVPSDDKSGVRSIGEKGLTELAAVLVILGSSPDIANENGESILTGAAVGGKVRTAALLVEAGANIEAKDKWGSTPLVLAAKHDQDRAVRFLLSKGANVNGASYYGWSALYWAADNGNLALVQYLVNNGAQVELKDRDGKSPLDVAKDKKHTLVEEYLAHVSK